LKWPTKIIHPIRLFANIKFEKRRRMSIQDSDLHSDSWKMNVHSRSHFRSLFRINEHLKRNRELALKILICILIPKKVDAYSTSHSRSLFRNAHSRSHSRSLFKIILGLFSGSRSIWKET